MMALLNNGGLDKKGGISLCGWGSGLGHGAWEELGARLGWSLGLRVLSAQRGCGM